MTEAETPREALEHIFAAVLLGADPVRRISIPDVREGIAACVEASLEALGLIDKTEGDPELTELLEFSRKCVKPWAEATVERGIKCGLREAPFASLSPDQIDRLAARLRAVVSEKLTTATFD